MTTQKGLSVEDLIIADVFTALMIAFIIVGGMFLQIIIISLQYTNNTV